jgi:2-iminobutanoate/2-iminopropanoate deaminase
MMPTRVHAIALALALALTSSAHPQTPASKQVISTPNAPEATGPYSQGIRAGNMVFLAARSLSTPRLSS